MPDQRDLDKRYFLTEDTYNCPYCRRGSVGYRIPSRFSFNWTEAKPALVFLVTCTSCDKTSMHVSFNPTLIPTNYSYPSYRVLPNYAKTIDDEIVFSIPASFFTIDERIPRAVRELVAEARNCRQGSYLVGASACLRKAIYEVLAAEKIAKTESDGKGGGRDRHYGDRVRDLKTVKPHMDPTFFDLLADAITATSDQLHEESWPGWGPKEFDTIFSATLGVLDEMYVLPDERKKRAAESSALLDKIRPKKVSEAADAEKPREPPAR